MRPSSARVLWDADGCNGDGPRWAMLTIIGDRYAGDEEIGAMFRFGLFLNGVVVVRASSDERRAAF